MNNDWTNLERTILRIEDTQYYTLCNIDALRRVSDPQENLCDCTRCVFKDTKELPYLGLYHRYISKNHWRNTQM